MFLPFLEVDIRQQAVDEMMQRIKKGVQLRPVNHSPRRAKRQVLLSPFESTWCPDMGLGGFSLNQKHIQLYRKGAGTSIHTCPPDPQSSVQCHADHRSWLACPAWMCSSAPQCKNYNIPSCTFHFTAPSPQKLFDGLMHTDVQRSSLLVLQLWLFPGCPCPVCQTRLTVLCS